MILAQLLVQAVGLLCLSSTLLLSACSQDEHRTQVTQDLPVPERALNVYVTDQVSIAGQDLALWYNSGQCQLQVTKGKSTKQTLDLKLKAPCYFMKAPATDRVQVYQRDKNSRVLAVLGTPVEASTVAKRCGTEVQGLIMNTAGAVRLSTTRRSGDSWCADQGLANSQYELFAKD